MSCELFCCEIPELLQYLKNDSEDKMIRQLFSILDSMEPLDNYLAGYFEKVLEMLFRKLTAPVMRLLNTEGAALLAKFLGHIDNYSIMQLVQRLLLPHIPFSALAVEMSLQDPQSELEEGELSCNWSYQPGTCQLLCKRMLTPAENPDVAAHVSDLLITVLQLSPPDALFLTHMCEARCLLPLVTAAVGQHSMRVPDVTEALSPDASVSLACVSVLESLVSKLCEVVSAVDANGQEVAAEDVATAEAVIQQNTTELCRHLLPSLPVISEQLRELCRTAQEHTICIQDHRVVPRLGIRGLQLVKLLESLIRIDEEAVDTAVVQSGALKASIDLAFVYDMNSMLHLAMQRMVVLILDGGVQKKY